MFPPLEAQTKQEAVLHLTLLSGAASHPRGLLLGPLSMSLIGFDDSGCPSFRKTGAPTVSLDSSLLTPLTSEDFISFITGSASIFKEMASIFRPAFLGILC